MSDTEFTETPRTATTIVAEALGVSPDALNQAAFARLGGTSLQAARAAHRIRRGPRRAADAVGLLSTSDLAGYLAGLPPVAADGPAAPVAPVAPGALVPLTWQQQLIWYQSLLDPEFTGYHFSALFHFTRAPEPAALDDVFRTVLDRFPVFRTRIVVVDGLPHQVVTTDQAAGAPGVAVVELDVQAPTPRELARAAGADRPFDLAEGPLVRWTLVRLPGGRATLVHTEHHLVHDGVSFSRLVDALAEDLPGRQEPDHGYFRYAASPRPDTAAEVSALASACAEVAPLVFASPAGPSDGAEESEDHFLRLPVPHLLLAAARRTAQEAGLSLFTVLFGAFTGAVGDVGGVPAGREYLIGTAVANRPPEHQETVGMFVSTVPVRCRRDADASPGERLRAAAEALREAGTRSDLPVSDLVRALRAVPGAAVREPLAVAFSLHEQPTQELVLAGERARVELGVFHGAAKFPVNVVVLANESAGTVELLIEGRRTEVSEDLLWQLWSGFVDELRALQGSPVAKPEPCAVPALDVVDAVRAAALDRPGAPAISDERDELSYAALAETGDRVAGRLAPYRGAGSTVALLGEASVRFFAAVYGVLRAGSGYIPLDQYQPVDRLALMLQHSDCDLLIDLTGPDHGAVADELAERMPQLRTVRWESLLADDAADRGPAEGDAVPPPGSGVAYTLFTSGTTGAPKGVQVSRDSLALLADWARAELALKPGSVVAQIASIGFDASVWEVWPTLTAGAQLRIAPYEARVDPQLLADWLERRRVEAAFAPTPVAEMLMDLPLPESLRVLAAGGDRLHPVPSGLGCEVLNIYGPTECTVVASSAWIKPGAKEMPSIGTVLPFNTHRLVDRSGQPVADGREGELWLGGGGLALGYLGLPAETATRFVPDPHSAAGEPVYRTGDIVRRRPDGGLDFLGRRDRQVKISGVRIEPAEVEATVLRLPGVQQAVVTADRVGGVQRLRLFVVPGAGADRSALRKEIRRQLPAYLHGSVVEFTTSMPLNRNGKVDLRMLSARPAAAPEQPALELAHSVLPDGDLDAPWFELSASSLDAARLVSRLGQELGLAPVLKELLTADSVKAYLLGLAPAPPAAAPAVCAPPSPAPAPAVAGPAFVAEVRPPAGSPEASAGPAVPKRPEASAGTEACTVLWPSLAALADRDKLTLAHRLLDDLLTP
ncbi:amino acid adenylation domain-containing protein [Streptomyces syringium]|uniref:amino acid adenylation domain-containing protein n=1 Tax=Streptomyces syringium TaxID=76729 RepID=UPI003451DD38